MKRKEYDGSNDLVGSKIKKLKFDLNDDHVDEEKEGFERKPKNIKVPPPSEEKKSDMLEEESIDELFEKTKRSGIDFAKHKNINVSVKGKNIPSSFDRFDELNDKIPNQILENVKRCKYDRPTPVQSHSIPILLDGRDMIGTAQTGSGKTAAFLLPVISQIFSQKQSEQAEKETSEGIVEEKEEEEEEKDTYAYKPVRPYALIMGPTRELVIQIQKESRKFSHDTGIETSCIYGGERRDAQRRKLQKLNGKCDILVATPGRLIDFLKDESVDLSNVHYIVMDEADRMLDFGFEDQLYTIYNRGKVPKDRQTLLFSATFSLQLQYIALKYMSEYISLTVGKVGQTTDSIEQKVLFVPKQDKNKVLLKILEQRRKVHLETEKSKETKKEDSSNEKSVENDNIKETELTLIFVRAKVTSLLLHELLSDDNGYQVTVLNGDLTQQERLNRLEMFRNKQAQILIATDIAARGLDVNDIKHVINFDFPNDFDTYIHRIGRTGRAGRRGLATTFFNYLNFRFASSLEKLLISSKQKVPEWLSMMSINSIDNIMKEEDLELRVIEPRKETVDSFMNFRFEMKDNEKSKKFSSIFDSLKGDDGADPKPKNTEGKTEEQEEEIEKEEREHTDGSLFSIDQILAESGVKVGTQEDMLAENLDDQVEVIEEYDDMEGAEDVKKKRNKDANDLAEIDRLKIEAAKEEQKRNILNKYKHVLSFQFPLNLKSVNNMEICPEPRDILDKVIDKLEKDKEQLEAQLDKGEDSDEEKEEQVNEFDISKYTENKVYNAANDDEVERHFLIIDNISGKVRRSKLQNIIRSFTPKIPYFSYKGEKHWTARYATIDAGNLSTAAKLKQNLHGLNVYGRKWKVKLFPKSGDLYIGRDDFTVVLYGLPKNIDEEQIKQFCSSYGKVRNVILIKRLTTAKYNILMKQYGIEDSSLDQNGEESLDSVDTKFLSSKKSKVSGHSTEAKSSNGHTSEKFQPKQLEYQKEKIENEIANDFSEDVVDRGVAYVEFAKIEHAQNALTLDGGVFPGSSQTLFAFINTTIIPKNINPELIMKKVPVTKRIREKMLANDRIEELTRKDNRAFGAKTSKNQRYMKNYKGYVDTKYMNRGKYKGRSEEKMSYIEKQMEYEKMHNQDQNGQGEVVDNSKQSEEVSETQNENKHSTRTDGKVDTNDERFYELSPALTTVLVEIKLNNLGSDVSFDMISKSIKDDSINSVNMDTIQTFFSQCGKIENIELMENKIVSRRYYDKNDQEDKQDGMDIEGEKSKKRSFVIKRYICVRAYVEFETKISSIRSTALDRTFFNSHFIRVHFAQFNISSINRWRNRNREAMNEQFSNFIKKFVSRDEQKEERDSLSMLEKFQSYNKQVDSYYDEKFSNIPTLLKQHITKNLNIKGIDFYNKQRDDDRAGNYREKRSEEVMLMNKLKMCNEVLKKNMDVPTQAIFTKIPKNASSSLVTQPKKSFGKSKSNKIRKRVKRGKRSNTKKK